MVYSRILAQHTAVFTSAHPNAGLPDVYGNYTLTAEAMARQMRPFAEERLVNILGGCCGTTPEHIRALSSMVKETENIRTKGCARGTGTGQSLVERTGCIGGT